MRGLRPLAESSTKRLSASVARAATRPRARSTPTRRSVSSWVESAAPASMPARLARSPRSGVRVVARGAAADASESADNVVIFELVDHAFIPPLADGVAELEFDDGLGH